MRTTPCAAPTPEECGVTKELAPDAWQEINTGADQLARENNISFHFPFTPIAPGDTLSCGGYDFEIVPLYGHTAGQCGLVERKKKLFFCADQVILGLTPIVITSGKDQHLLAEYFASLKALAADYAGYRFPGHLENSPRSVRRPAASSMNMRHAAPSSGWLWQKAAAP